MSTTAKAAIHELVDQLSEENAVEALAYIRLLISERDDQPALAIPPACAVARRPWWQRLLGIERADSGRWA